MTDDLYWIWMQEALGAGSLKADWVARELGSPETLWRMSAQELADTGRFAPKEIAQIKSTTLAGAERNIVLAEKFGCAIITPDHPDFPENLRNIDCAPCVLYVYGDFSGLDDELILTMVGTRTNDEYGLTCAAQLSADLAAAGCTVASGLAVGIDCACHAGALSAKGRTIGLLACGMDVNYPTATNHLKRQIVDNGGVLVTEFPFGQKVQKYSFHVRNRILSGIADGVVVVQAPERSGALITANYALTQNREVFAVPGEISDPNMAGCNRLIAKNAYIVVNVYSILEQFTHKFPEKLDPKLLAARLKTSSLPMRTQQVARLPRKVYRQNEDGREEILMVAQEAAVPLRRLSETDLQKLGTTDAAKRIYGMLSREPASVDWLVGQAGLSAMECMVALTELELFELAEALPGKRYVIRERA